MKKLFTLFSFILLSHFSFSQNAIGYSWSDVNKMVKQEGFIVDYGQTKNKISYISGSDNGKIRIYYFTDNNVCFSYVLIIENADFNLYRESLIENGYVGVGGKYYKDNYVAEIVWMESEKIHILKFNFNEKNTKNAY